MRAVVAALVCVVASATHAHAGPRDLPGWPLYDRYCLACHGAAGDGHGPAAPFTWGRPRDLTRGAFAWRSTETGGAPTPDDLRATIRFGVPGTSMPGFGGGLAPAQVDQLIEVVEAFAPAAFARPGRAVALGPPPPVRRDRGAELWTRLGCVPCHGAEGRGDGPAAHALDPPPYDLTAAPLHHPRARDDAAARRRAAALSIATGLAGTAMPGYAGQVSGEDLWALADHVLALAGDPPPPDRGVLAPAAIAADAAAKLATGTYPGAGEPRDQLFGARIAPQGPAPAALAPAEASLRARRCGRCHAAQVRAWRGSIHAAAAGPGLAAQLADHGTPSGTCDRCHAPLAEQQPGEPFAPELRGEGVTCAACHLRGWVRHGPPRVSPSLLPVPSYPREGLAIYERADFCEPCHQLPARFAVAGKPLLDTYREWLEGPYMRRGIECQHCHMPNREHTWLGVHDPETFRQGIRLDARAARTPGGAVTATATLANVGAGHDLPTTPTPAAWLRIELRDAQGRAIAGARGELRIGREVWADRTGWHQRSDTRIRPGGHVTLARAWSGGRTAAATTARITVEVHPDDYYERLYERQLAGHLPAATRALYERAIARARRSHYLAEQRDIPIALSSTDDPRVPHVR